MQNLLQSFNDRHIWRVLIAYPSVTFIWLQAIEFFVNNYDLDARLLTASIIAAAVLFPAAVIWNWRHGEVGRQAFTHAELGAYALSGVAAIVIVAWYWNITPATMQETDLILEPVRTIAVMPFENTGDDSGVQFLCDGIAENLINWLATVPGVKVVSKSAAFRLRDSIDDTAAIARKLGVDGVVRGRLEKVGQQVVISTSFVDTRDDSQLWGERLVRPLGEAIYLERSIVDAIKDGLRLEMSDELETSSASGGTEMPLAYEHYLRGHFLIQSTNTDEIYEGLDELRVAVKIDPQFALPYADIADSLSQMISYGIEHDDDLLREAQNAAYAAVALAPELPEAQTALASMLQYIVFDWAKTDAAYEAAIALHPQSTVPYHRYADYLSLTLRFKRAQEMAAKAIAVDALDSSALHSVGIAKMMAGDFPAAVTAFGDWNRFHPNSRWSYVKYALALALNGECELSLKQATTVEKLLGELPSSLMDAWLAWGYHVCGAEQRYLAAKARIEAKLLAEPDGIDPGVAYLYAIDGNVDGLVALVDRVVTTKNSFTPFMRLFLIDYLGWGVSDRMPTDPRYLAILEKLNFPPRD
jgi:TolB-like protein